MARTGPGFLSVCVEEALLHDLDCVAFFVSGSSRYIHLRPSTAASPNSRGGGFSNAQKTPGNSRRRRPGIPASASPLPARRAPKPLWSKQNAGSAPVSPGAAEPRHPPGQAPWASGAALPTSSPARTTAPFRHRLPIPGPHTAPPSGCLPATFSPAHIP